LRFWGAGTSQSAPAAGSNTFNNSFGEKKKEQEGTTIRGSGLGPTPHRRTAAAPHLKSCFVGGKKDISGLKKMLQYKKTPTRRRRTAWA